MGLICPDSRCRFSASRKAGDPGLGRGRDPGNRDIFKIDMERHGDGVDGTEAKERELAHVSQFKLRCYFQSADYYIINRFVFERHE